LLWLEDRSKQEPTPTQQTQPKGKIGAFVLGASTFVRWWFGLSYVLGGTGAAIAGPIMLANGDGGGVSVPDVSTFWLEIRAHLAHFIRHG
jgi:hypothetical protein